MTRWIVIFWIFVVAAVSFLDRNNIAIAASLVQKEFGLTNVELGAVFSAFVAGYAFSQPLAGYVADRFGAYRSVAISIVWWSIFTTLTAWVPVGMAWSFALLFSVRLLLGIGEAVMFPASNRLVANWIPSKERGLANGIIFAGVGVGAGLAPTLITYIMLSMSWRWAFYVSALIGLVAGVVWLLVVRERPQEHPAVGSKELAHIEAGLPPRSSAVSQVRWRDLMFDRQMMLLTASYFCYGYVAYIFFTWFFKYLSDVRGLDLKASALYATLPFIAMAVACPVGGLLSDKIAAMFGKRLGRCGVAALGLSGAGLFVWLATRAVDAQVAALILAGGAGALYIAQSAYWSISADMGGQSAGRVSGTMNMGAQTGGMITATLTPMIADSYGWTASFVTAAAIAMTGAVLWFFIDPSHELSPGSRLSDQALSPSNVELEDLR